MNKKKATVACDPSHGMTSVTNQNLEGGTIPGPKGQSQNQSHYVRKKEKNFSRNFSAVSENEEITNDIQHIM